MRTDGLRGACCWTFLKVERTHLVNGTIIVKKENRENKCLINTKHKKTDGKRGVRMLMLINSPALVEPMEILVTKMS